VLGCESGNRRGRGVEEEPVDVVLDDRDVVARGDARDLRPPRFRHHGSSRVLQRRHGVQRADARLAARGLERLGDEPLVIDRHGEELYVQKRVASDLNPG
jgi:hypothetical protein